jgi:MinD-like ATPase involved in chromosome partitioning or flagellar assembly
VSTAVPRPGGPGGRVPVLLAAAGARWEAAALDRLERGGAAVVLARRCVDLADLLASASAGTAAVAVVAPNLPGLDADSVAALRRGGVSVLAVGEPDELEPRQADRLRRLGIEQLLPSSEVDGLVDRVRAAAAPAVATQADGVPESPASLLDDPEPGAEPGSGRRRPRGRLVAVWGPAGAPGRTTVAVGLAAALAQDGHEALLVDADPYGGTVAQHLGVLEEVSGILAAARAANAGLLDADGLAGMARQVGGGLRLLTGLPRADRWTEVRRAAFERVLEDAPLLADHVVLDTGFSLESDPGDAFGGAPQRNAMTLDTLQAADDVVVVGAADPVGLARLARGLVALREVLPAVRPHVVVNRARASLGWSEREVSGMVEGFLTPAGVHFLPDDRLAADRALMAGRSLVEVGDSALGEALSALASAVTGRPAGASGRRGRGLRRRRAGTAR